MFFVSHFQRVQRREKNFDGRGGVSSKNWALNRSSEFWPQADIVFYLILIKWKIKNCNIRKDMVSFNKRKQIYFSVLGLVLNGSCPEALLGSLSKDDDSNERNNLARA